MISDLLHKARAKFELVRLSRGKGIVSVEVPEIPKEKQRFLDTTDEWQLAEFPEELNTTGCIYYAKKGNYFPPHKHNDSTEQILILNKGGRIKSISENGGIQYIEYPNSVFYEKAEGHAVEWLEDTVCLITWHPAFKQGWEADFKEEK